MAPPARAPIPAPIRALRRSLPPASVPSAAPARPPSTAPPAVLETFCSPVYGSVVQAATRNDVAITTSTAFFMGFPLTLQARSAHRPPFIALVSLNTTKSGTATIGDPRLFSSSLFPARGLGGFGPS